MICDCGNNHFLYQIKHFLNVGLQCPNLPMIGYTQSVLMRDSLGREQRCASHKKCASHRTGLVIVGSAAGTAGIPQGAGVHLWVA